ncbi:hypothetical protein [Rhodococcus tibetensis]|uniref:Uncharacterized protein n=1 Tax=Rhodococcus tibetensis TaxID=2965064 RepID=A0ABT1QEJ6_9NOCA|nr:hypothetical protein [Rhodococcus sp. FXJ9.536]MCQ4120713.1 hypothetical protein [Rhodococcus sp. FXJ9.536]
MGARAAASGTLSPGLRRPRFSATFAYVPRSVLIQLGSVVALMAVGTMLVLVGAFGGGFACLLGGGIWFWRLYRDSEP